MQELELINKTILQKLS